MEMRSSDGAGERRGPAVPREGTQAVPGTTSARAGTWRRRGAARPAPAAVHGLPLRLVNAGSWWGSWRMWTKNRPWVARRVDRFDPESPRDNGHFGPFTGQKNAK
jgi:hypothetical protein